jgi:hypothetical protein
MIIITKKETKKNGTEEEKLTECLLTNSGTRMMTSDLEETTEMDITAKEKASTMDTKAITVKVNLATTKTTKEST